MFLVKSTSEWNEVTDVRNITRIWLKPSGDEILDLQWSPDSIYLLVGMIDSKVCKNKRFTKFFFFYYTIVNKIKNK
jgi:hypothetical protein